MKKRKKGLFSVLLSLAIIPLIVSISIITIISLNSTRNNMEKQIYDVLKIASNNLSIHCEDKNISFGSAGAYYDYIDSLIGQNIELAIVFEGGQCVSSIKNDNDFRAREITFNKDFKEHKEILLKGYSDNKVKIGAGTYYGYFMPITDKGELVAMAFAGRRVSYVTDSIKNNTLNTAILTIILTVVFALLVLLVSKKISKSVNMAGEALKVVATGDLTADINNKSGIRELYMLVDSTANMQANLKEIIVKVKATASELDLCIEDVTGLSDESAAKAKQISQVIGEMSDTASDMAETVQAINEKMKEMGICISEMTDNVYALNVSADRIAISNHEAKNNMDSIMISNDRSVEAIDSIVKCIRETNDAIGEIENAVGLILGISDQTSLLSLNASIEAARAGEMGKGFAVVADEIRTLSEQSAEGAETIRSIATEIIDKSRLSVELADKVVVLMRDEHNSINSTQERYKELSDGIEDSIARIKEIADKTKNLSEYRDAVIDSTQDLSAVSEENYASSEEVNANVTEILSQVELVNDKCENISKMAQELEVSVSYFKSEE